MSQTALDLCMLALEEMETIQCPVQSDQMLTANWMYWHARQYLSNDEHWRLRSWVEGRDQDRKRQATSFTEK
jgi:hypothetical protein